MDGTISIQNGVLIGRISSPIKLTGSLTRQSSLSGRLAIPVGYTHYLGNYEVTPRVDSQTMPTKDKVMADDVTVKAIPYYEVSNQQGGLTIIIGGNI